MNENTIKIQGRWLSDRDISFISEVISNNPSWGRRKVSIHICEEWDWKDERGQVKDIACRTLLRKLEERGEVSLPAPKVSIRKGFGLNEKFTPCDHSTLPLECLLKHIQPIKLVPVTERSERLLWQTYLYKYHYLSFRTLVGRSLSYLVYDKEHRELACLLFGAAAWKCAPRDRFIGWNVQQREDNLHRIANNMRYLILPWVRIPHLASHILGLVARQIEDDWYSKYRSEISLLETFVEKNRFAGTCYKAANWINVGETTGRTRQDRYSSICAPIKTIHLLPLDRHFRTKLCPSP